MFNLIDTSLAFAQIHHAAWLILLIFARFYGVFKVFLLFSKRLPAMIRGGLSMLFAAMSAPYFYSLTLPDGGYLIFLLLAKEVIYGALIGYLLTLPILLIEAAGNIIDLQRGEQFGAIVNQLTNNPDSSIAKLLTQSFIAYFVIANGFIFIFEFTFKSFFMVGLTEFLPHGGVDQYINLIDSFFYWVVIIAIPVVIIMFLLEGILGLVSSFIPQLNVTVISMPLKSGLAMFILIFYIPTMFHLVMSNFMTEIRLFHL